MISKASAVKVVQSEQQVSLLEKTQSSIDANINELSGLLVAVEEYEESLLGGESKN